MSYPYQIKTLEEYKTAYKESLETPESFWSDVANNFYWHKKWDKVLEWNFKEPSIKWYQGAKLNITENCLDRHLKALSDQFAIIWEPNNPTEKKRVLTYKELHQQVCRFSNVLKNNTRTRHCCISLCKDWCHSFGCIWRLQRSKYF